MLRHQDQRLHPPHGGSANSSFLRNKDSNFNFLPGGDDGGLAETRRGRGDENRNQVRPCNLALGRDPQSSPASGFQLGSALVSPRSRLPCWSPLEPLPEIETAEDGCGRVPPDGAEKWRTEEKEAGMILDEKTERQGKEEGDDEWGDSDPESEYSRGSGGSVSSLNVESGWDRIGVGEPKPSGPDAGLEKRSSSHGPEGRNHGDNQSSDSDGDPLELMDAVWTLRDRERFKAQEMEKHQVQLTMYRRLALIRWVRALQGRVQEQQNRLQSSFDVILTHRKELLRMGAAATVAQS